jgi:hypothetical protein
MMNLERVVGGFWVVVAENMKREKEMNGFVC